MSRQGIFLRGWILGSKSKLLSALTASLLPSFICHINTFLPCLFLLAHIWQEARFLPSLCERTGRWHSWQLQSIIYYDIHGYGRLNLSILAACLESVRETWSRRTGKLEPGAQSITGQQIEADKHLHSSCNVQLVDPTPDLTKHKATELYDMWRHCSVHREGHASIVVRVVWLSCSRLLQVGNYWMMGTTSKENQRKKQLNACIVKYCIYLTSRPRFREEIFLG